MDVVYAFDLNCPWSWMTSRWLVGATTRHDDRIVWRALSLAHLNAGKDLPDRVQQSMATGRRAHRLMQYLQGGDQTAAMAAFYDAYGTLVHRRGEPRSPETLRAALAEAGLPAEVGAAAEDPTLDAEIEASTDRWVGAAGGDGGSPVIQFGDGPAFFGPLLDEVPDAGAGDRLYRALRDVADIPAFLALRRGRVRDPQLATS